MSLIDSTLKSPLAATLTDPEGDEDGLDQDVAPDEFAEGLYGPGENGNLVRFLTAQVDDINLARYIDQQTLDAIGSTCVDEYRLDENSRSEWLDKAQKAMKFAIQTGEPKQYPWPGASNTIYPLITQAALSFGARTYPAIIQGPKVVKGTVWGSDRGTPATVNGKPDGEPKVTPGPNGQPQPVWLVAPGEKRLRADRIGEFMSWQLIKEMPEWEPQTDQLLHQIPVIGGAGRKTFRDPVENRNYSLFVSLINLVWDYNAPSFEAAPRHTEKLVIYPHQIIENERAGREDEDDEGMFLAIEYGPGGGDESDMRRADGEVANHDSADPDAPHLFIEQHRRWDIDGDGYPEPYVITVHERSGRVVRIVARYDEDGIHASKDGKTINRIASEDHYTLIPFLPNIDGGSYPMGFGHLLRPLNEAINTTLNMMFDAGHLQNAGGGFISDQIGIPSGQTFFQVGKYTRVTNKGAPIRDSVFPLPFQGPNAVLFQLLGLLLSAGKEVASIQDILAGDAAIANAPPTTVLALIEQGLKVYTAIHKRVFRALTSEFEKLYRLNRRYLKEATTYHVGDEEREIHPDDFRLGGGVEPVADPTMVTDMQRLVRAQIISGYAGNPLMNQKEIIMRNLEAANVDRIDDLFAPPDPTIAIQAQFAMQREQAELGRLRAAEQKDQTQAYLNLAMARAKASAPEMDFIEKNLDLMRLHIEALNTTVKAAQVDHKFHDTRMKATTAQANLEASTGLPASPTPTPDAQPDLSGFPGPDGGLGAAPAPAPAAAPAVPVAPVLGAPT